MRNSPNDAIDFYLRSGEYDDSFTAWSDESFFANAKQGDAALRAALISAVRNRTPHAIVPNELIDLDLIAFTRKKVAPMVQGLFVRSEQQLVLNVLERSVVFLTPANIGDVLKGMQYLGTAWNIANVYLGSVGAELLSDDASSIVGLSIGTTCYVSIDYFRKQNHLDDFVVHEAAHIFHNCKRKTIGLRGTGRHEWLLEIDFAKRETFAYACEAYSRILTLENNASARKALLSEIEDGGMPADEQVDVDEYINILHEAVSARNGWKRILARCAPTKTRRPKIETAQC